MTYDPTPFLSDGVKGVR